MFIDNPQFPLPGGDLISQAPVTLPEGDKHEYKTTHQKFVHGGSSLMTDRGTWHRTAAPGAQAGIGKRHVITRYLFPCTIHLERAEILTTS
jgi:hypothetical protein